MANESTMRRRVLRALRPLHGIAVENPVLPGTPDVNYVEGWIELKRLDKWPARKTTVVRIPTYTPQQKVFAVRRRRVGGQSWFLLQVGNEWLLLDAADAAVSINKSTRQELISKTLYYWGDGLVDEELVNVLRDTVLTPWEVSQLDQR